MALTIKFRRILITDEDQVNPTKVNVQFSVHTDQADVTTVNGKDEIGRYEAKCISTRAAAQALLNTCNIQNDSEIPASVLALLVAAGMPNP